MSEEAALIAQICFEYAKYKLGLPFPPLDASGPWRSKLNRLSVEELKKLKGDLAAMDRLFSK